MAITDPQALISNFSYSFSYVQLVSAGQLLIGSNPRRVALTIANNMHSGVYVWPDFSHLVESGIYLVQTGQIGNYVNLLFRDIGSVVGQEWYALPEVGSTGDWVSVMETIFTP